MSRGFRCQYIVYIKVGADFKAWVEDKMKEQEIFLINKHTFTINVLPEFAEGFAKYKLVLSKLYYLA